MKKIETIPRMVEFLAPESQSTHKAAQRTSEEMLQGCPGATTLEFDMVPQKLHDPIDNIPGKILAGQNELGSYCSTPTMNQLAFSHQLRLKCAEYWMRLGEADEALRELEALPLSAWNHSSVVEARVAAIRVLKGKSQVIV